MTTIKLKNGSGAPTSGDLAQGEPALDLTNKRLYTEDSGGTVIEVGTNPGVDVTFADNRKAIFGAGSDLQIYHDGTHSRVVDAGTGNLNLQGDNLRLKTADAVGTYLEANNGGAVTITYNSSPKLATTSTGIDVTGTVVSDGLTVDGTPVRFVSTAPMLNFMESGVTDSNHRLRQNAGNFVIQKLSDDEGTATDRFLIDGGTGDISFYEDTGTTAKLQWSASNERLTIPTLTISDGSITTTAASGDHTVFNSTGADADFRVRTGANTHSLYVQGNTGNVGLGTDSPQTSLSIETSGTQDVVSPVVTGQTAGVTYGGLYTVRDDAGDQRGLALQVYTANVGLNEAMRITSGGILEFNDNAVISVNDTADSMYIGGGGTVPNTIQNQASALHNWQIGGSNAMRLDASGNLLVGTTETDIGYTDSGAGCMLASEGTLQLARSSSNANLYLNKLDNDGEIINFRKDGTTVGSIGTASSYLTIGSPVGSGGHLLIGNNLVHPATSTGGAKDNAIDIGGSSNRFKNLYLSGSVITGGTTTNNFGSIDFKADSVRARIIGGYASGGGGYLKFQTDSTGGSDLERMRLDAEGNLLVGTTNVNPAANNVTGHALKAGGLVEHANSGAMVMRLNRTDSSGSIIEFKQGTSAVGSIGTAGGDLTVGTGDTGLTFEDSADVIHPINQGTGGARDNAIDLGKSAARFKDLYATNGTIQTSDRNEKQDIAELSDAEQRVAVACKGLLRKFRWKSAVEDKGDEARIHFGIIAQDLQDAFTAEGLDAGRYAMFINSTWTDEETGEERSRMGVRYSELLAFIIAAI